MHYSIESITIKLKIYEGTLIRLCEYLGVNLYDQTLDCRMGAKAILSDYFVQFLEENKDFYKRYHDDYYSTKTPEKIASTINRDVETVIDYLYRKFPDWNRLESKGSAIKKFKYISSFEIDFDLGLEQHPDILNMDHVHGI